MVCFLFCGPKSVQCIFISLADFDMVINRTRLFSNKKKQQKLGDEITTCV